MTDETEDKGVNDAAESLPNVEGSLNSLMRMIAYKDIVQRFNDAISSIMDSSDPEQREQLNQATLHMQALAANLDPTQVLSAALVVVTRKTGPDGQEGFALQRGLLGSTASLDALLPLTHLLFGFEQEGVMPPDLTGMDVEIEGAHEPHPTEQ